MKTCPTYYANIYCGVRPSYDQTIKPEELKLNLDLVKKICKKYCDDVGLGLTITQTEFVYTDGDEPGVIVGLINYPRFPSSPFQIKFLAGSLAAILLHELKQERLSIMYPDETVMLEKDSL